MKANRLTFSLILMLAVAAAADRGAAAERRLRIQQVGADRTADRSGADVLPFPIQDLADRVNRLATDVGSWLLGSFAAVLRT